jgi:transcriptional regulator with XRE-family HTH domain
MARNLSLPLGRRIKTRRLLCWMSQEEFANRVGVSRRQVVYWEADTDAPSAERLRSICEVLNVSADWLLTGKGWLREVRDDFAAEQRRKYLERSAATIRKIRLYLKLPLDASKKQAASWMNVLPEDGGAIGLQISSDVFSPTYTKGDTLLMRPVNIALNGEFGSLTSRTTIADLDSRDVVAVFNGESSLSRLTLEADKKSCRAQLHPINGRANARKVVTARPGDDLLIQAVVYKCLRSV